MRRTRADVLLKANADVDAQDAIGNVPLFYAAVEGDPPGTEKLITGGANVNRVNKSNVSPLMCAVWQNQQTIMEMLLAQNAAVDTADVNGNTALHYAAQIGNPLFVRRLLEVRLEFPVVKYFVFILFFPLHCALCLGVRVWARQTYWLHTLL